MGSVLGGNPQAAGVAAQGVVALHQMAGIALGRQVERRVHARDTATDDHGTGGDLQLHLLQGAEQGGLGHGHAHQVLGLLGGRLGIIGVHPGVLVADVGHLEQVLVQPGA